MNETIGILAGTGRLPEIVAHTIRQSEKTPFIVNLTGAPLEWMREFNSSTIKVTQLSKLIACLRAHKVQNLVLAGGMYCRPEPRDFLFEWRMYGELWHLFKALKKGDDGLLRACIEFLERKQFIVKSVLDFAPFLAVESQILTKQGLRSDELLDIKTAVSAAQALGRLDKGQAVVVREGKIIAQEDRRGTQFMLEEVAREAKQQGVDKSSGFLVKWSKPNQELRVDLPTIGLDTLSQVHKARLSGIVLEAERALILDKEAVLRAANSMNISIVGMT